MADEIKSNLEPIEDTDMDLKNKFLGGEAAPQKVEKPSVERKVENLSFPEKAPERKEGAAEKDAAYSKILAKAKLPVVSAPNANAVATDAQNISVEKSAEAKIDRLVKIAMNNGVVHAVKVARHLDDNYALDEFHDRLLAEDLHDALVQKGLIREI